MVAEEVVVMETVKDIIAGEDIMVTESDSDSHRTKI